METKILVVDDEEIIRDIVADFLKLYPYCIDKAEGVKQAMGLMESTEYDVIITDKNIPDIDGTKEGGMNILRHAKKHLPTAEVIMMTGYATINTAVEAMKLGAFDYLAKPFVMSELKEKIDRILAYKSFINPENTLQIYKTLHNEMLNLLGNRSNLTDDELHELLKSLDTRIDRFFKTQKEWERIILIQREALAKIAGYIERLKQAIPRTDPSYTLAKRIWQESSKRL